jgi:DNA polymerase I
MDLVFDIETDDIQATLVHCIVAQDADSGEIFKFPPHKLAEGYQFLTTADRLIGHNVIGFDIPLVEKFGGVDLSKIEVIDTLVLSRLFNPTRDGGHSLESWGFRLGLAKIVFEDYLNYSSEMLEYCVRDVQVNTLVYNALRQESKGFSKECIEIEQSVAKIVKQQEVNGFKFDMKSALTFVSRA